MTQNFSPYGSDTSEDENGASVREEILEVAARDTSRPQSGFSSACDPGRDALLLRSREWRNRFERIGKLARECLLFISHPSFCGERERRWKRIRRCCGIDVHQKTVVVCVLAADGTTGKPVKKVYGSFVMS